MKCTININNYLKKTHRNRGSAFTVFFLFAKQSLRGKDLIFVSGWIFYQIFKMQRRSILLCYFHNTHRYILNIYLYRRVFSLRIKLHFYSPLSNYVRKMFAARKSVLKTEMIYIKMVTFGLVLFKKKLKM